jgi:MarR family transcriptional regulator, organic hydroperoxide resistance regulator
MDEAWTLLYDLVMTERARLPQIAAEFDVSPAQVHALRVLEPGAEVPMGRLARALGCDASNVTGIVDRLERRGLVERRAQKQDRRVRVLVITGPGARLREQILVRIAQPPAPIARLSDDDRRALCAILRRAAAGD